MDEQRMEGSYILSFGGGINTVALMVILLNEKAPLDGVVFADTGGGNARDLRLGGSRALVPCRLRDTFRGGESQAPEH